MPPYSVVFVPRTEPDEDRYELRDNGTGEVIAASEWRADWHQLKADRQELQAKLIERFPDAGDPAVYWEE
ncbi:hypothetical protein ASE71_18410 [Ensifer sp. Root954]|nr:hypothetical protein ASE29_28245 [Ensifer sp. Root74]KRD74257.1 hypothetical protein ASE71_18410 [Ensifer sp. Root954]